MEQDKKCEGTLIDLVFSFNWSQECISKGKSIEVARLGGLLVMPDVHQAFSIRPFSYQKQPVTRLLVVC